jgi:hypothetical protein
MTLQALCNAGERYVVGDLVGDLDLHLQHDKSSWQTGFAFSSVFAGL